jgi:4'-phosphopantetheinyl transferase
LLPPRRDDAFFRLWTHREALLKAIGTGLAADPSVTQRAAGRDSDFRQWRVRPLVLGPGYAGAVAAEGREWLLRCWIAP